MTLALKYEEEDQCHEQAVNLVRRSQPERDGTKIAECYACGRKGHLKPDCRFKNATCRNCRKKGHLQVVCNVKTKHYVKEAAPSDVEEGDDGDTIELEHNFLSKNESISVLKIIAPDMESAPFRALVRIGEEEIAMEIDSGATISAVSERFCKEKFSSLEVRETKLRLVGYSGEHLKVQGCVEPVVSFNGITKRLQFAVVQKGGPPLLGRNFLRVFGLHIAPLNYVSGENTEEKLSKLLNQYECLFSEKLGKYNGMKVEMTLEEGAKPIFCKPRPVPLSLEKSVEHELNEAEEKGVITKCDSSDWGTPVVPVLKHDGESIRLCGDYKVTVNKFVKDVRHPLPRIEEVMGKLNGGKKFSKLDLSRAYNQFELSDESRKKKVQYSNKRSGIKVPKKIRSVPEKPWSRIHLDYAGPVNGIWYLIIIDALTKWPEVFPTVTITASFTIERLMECLARFGLVDTIVTDNGTQFTAQTFKYFLAANVSAKPMTDLQPLQKRSVLAFNQPVLLGPVWSRMIKNDTVYLTVLFNFFANELLGVVKCNGSRIP
ncbi:uncharacterized protein K02A2.6-like [Armigeres subalbatus]|uniref:uncharacterized protein K02A2.6-like n=1 Tax=Armigeres subalbatus TaxID=124917 RepID=UPI002ED62700